MTLRLSEGPVLFTTFKTNVISNSTFAIYQNKRPLDSYASPDQIRGEKKKIKKILLIN